MAYYIKDKETGEWQRYDYDEGWYDHEEDYYWGAGYYLVADEFKWSTRFYSQSEAEGAIYQLDCGDLEDYEIVEVI